MSFSIGKILAIPALFFAFGINPSYAQESPAKAKTEQFNEPEIKKILLNLDEESKERFPKGQQVNRHIIPKTENTFTALNSNRTSDILILPSNIVLPVILSLLGIAAVGLIASLL